MVDLSEARVVAVLARAPQAEGTAGSKTRLFAGLGLAPDPALLAALLLDTVDGAAAERTVRVVAVEPPEAVEAVRALLPPRVDVLAQIAGDLGQRMRSVMATLFDRGARAVAVIGSDLPDISPRQIEAAFAALERRPGRLVLGPAMDGGYYLIAATRVPEVFDGVAWGSADVLAQTRAAADREGLDVHLLEVLRDVDTPDDLRAVRAPRTAAWVRTARI